MKANGRRQQPLPAAICDTLTRGRAGEPVLQAWAGKVDVVTFPGSQQ